MSATTVLLYGRSGSGKSTQLGVLAEDIYVRTKKKTRLYTADRGGMDVIAPHINLGIIEPIELGDSDVWLWLNRAAKGWIRDSSGKWSLDKVRNAEIGMYAFESAHGIAQLMKLDIERKAAAGINFGDTNTSFEIVENGERLKIGTSKGYQKFAIPQTRIQEEMMEAQKLPAEYVWWSAGIDKDDDEVATNKVVGPSVIGKALTTTLPKDFNFTFRIDVLPAQGGKPERHLLYLGNHIDTSAGNATTLGNIRRPLDAAPLKDLIIEPANIVTALRVVREESQKQATEVLRKRIGLIVPKGMPEVGATK